MSHMANSQDARLCLVHPDGMVRRIVASVARELNLSIAGSGIHSSCNSLSTDQEKKNWRPDDSFILRCGPHNTAEPKPQSAGWRGSTRLKQLPSKGVDRMSR